MENSLDPRVNRTVNRDGLQFHPSPEMDQWQTYEVFHQAHRGEQHQHVGIVHAPSPEMALLFAKEQFARREKTVNLWVVRTADVYCSEYEDSDMFEPAFDKSYREASYYRNRERIEDFLRGADKIVLGGKKNYMADLKLFEGESPAQTRPAAATHPVGKTRPVTVVGAPGTIPPQQANVIVND